MPPGRFVDPRINFIMCEAEMRKRGRCESAGAERCERLFTPHESFSAEIACNTSESRAWREVTLHSIRPGASDVSPLPKLRQWPLFRVRCVRYERAVDPFATRQRCGLGPPSATVRGCRPRAGRKTFSHVFSNAKRCLSLCEEPLTVHRSHHAARLPHD